MNTKKGWPSCLCLSFVALADVFDGPREIERFAAEMLRTSAGLASLSELSDTSSGCLPLFLKR